MTRDPQPGAPDPPPWAVYGVIFGVGAFVIGTSVSRLAWLGAVGATAWAVCGVIWAGSLLRGWLRSR
jgi:hypothetical protein